jgi:hypothetical protein
MLADLAILWGEHPFIMSFFAVDLLVCGAAIFLVARR